MLIKTKENSNIQLWRWSRAGGHAGWLPVGGHMVQRWRTPGSLWCPSCVCSTLWNCWRWTPTSHGPKKKERGSCNDSFKCISTLPRLPTDLGGDGELGDDDCDGVGVLGQLPGAGQLHHLLVGVSGVGQQGFGVSKALDQGLDLVEVSLLPEQLGLLEVAWQRKLWCPQEVEDVAETAERETGSVQTAELRAVS